MLMTDPERIPTTEVRFERLLLVVRRFAFVRSRAPESAVRLLLVTLRFPESEKISDSIERNLPERENISPVAVAR
jgi:hypothetical protein